ncbi:hypothetical protein [Streptomyces sp. NPDC001165]|uniref:hypothetical protein n=1 Tax=Streptomyces sp. NPDC001165 TaxID=3364546 RepID=UPI0036B1BB13
MQELPFPRTPFTLDGDRLVETRADGTVTERRLADEAEARRVVEEEFGIAVPEGITLLG